MNRKQAWRAGSAEERFRKKFIIADDGCWLWTAKVINTGYGAFYSGTKMVLAHRWSYEHFVGPIPDGLQIDHLCRNQLCVNSAHLEPVTAQENVLRSTSSAAVYARRAHCSAGHPYDTRNTSLDRGCRRCLTCHRERERRRRKERAA